MGHTQIGKENVRMHFNYVVSARYCISGTDIAPCGRIGDTRCSAAISESARSPGENESGPVRDESFTRTFYDV